jgi:23S rRNA (cytosine1962-C5)-methyltransferase
MAKRSRIRKQTGSQTSSQARSRARGGTLPFVQADAGIKPALAQGHPWIYRDAIERAPDDLPAGAWVHVQCGNLQLYGLWDDQGPIAVRLLESRRPPNRAWVAEQVQRAWERRAPLRNAREPVTAYRWLYGESDGLPGIVVDLYGEFRAEASRDGAREADAGQHLGRQYLGRWWAVLRTYSPSVEAMVPWVVDALGAILSPAGILRRDETGATLLTGELPPTPLIMAEYGVRFEADLQHGQKTGFFLDQRENRRALGEWVAATGAQRVLNLFSYTGGFSVAAALNGAARVTSVDSAEPATRAAARNFALNGLDPAQHEFVTADCFELLEKYHGEGRRFDLIVVDPPSFARSRAQQERALHAYRRLNTLAMQCLTPGGLLASSSCTSQVSPEAFRRMLAEAATEAKRRALILHEAGQPLDHPVPAHFPEARYLKFILAAVDGG